MYTNSPGVMYDKYALLWVVFRQTLVHIHIYCSNVATSESDILRSIAHRNVKRITMHNSVQMYTEGGDDVNSEIEI